MKTPLEGVWRVVSHVSRGEALRTPWTHHVFRGDRSRITSPGFVDYTDELRVDSWFTVRGDRSPYEVEVVERLLFGDGTCSEPLSRIVRAELDGDRLLLHHPLPDTDERRTVTLVREDDEILARRLYAPPQAGPRPSRHVEGLGIVRWHGQFAWWSTTFALDDGDVPVDILGEADPEPDFFAAAVRVRHAFAAALPGLRAAIDDPAARLQRVMIRESAVDVVFETPEGDGDVQVVCDLDLAIVEVFR